MSNASKKDEIKNVSASEFSNRLKEYAKKVKRTNKPPIPNEPVGQISKSKVLD